MAECNYSNGGCNRVATTTLMKFNGEIVQLCEEHRNELIAQAKHIVTKKLKTRSGFTEIEANHWLVINKIPS